MKLTESVGLAKELAMKAAVRLRHVISDKFDERGVFSHYEFFEQPSQGASAVIRLVAHMPDAIKTLRVLYSLRIGELEEVTGYSTKLSFTAVSNSALDVHVELLK